MVQLNEIFELKIDRVRSGIKAINIAQYLRISSGQLSKIEHGYANCPDELFQKIKEYVEANKVR